MLVPEVVAAGGRVRRRHIRARNCPAAAACAPSLPTSNPLNRIDL